MHPLYETASEVVDKLKAARLEVARLSVELSQAEYAIRLAQARVERGLIRKKGSEKNLAPTVEDRARIFVLALDADPEYREHIDRRKKIEEHMEEGKVEVAFLHDKLNLMLAAMRAAS